MTTSNLKLNIPVCHSKIRSFEWLIELIVRAKSHRKWYSVMNPVRYTEEENQNYENSRTKLKDLLYKSLAVNIGNAQEMVTGSSFKKFSSDEARNVIVNFLDSDMREHVKDIHLNLCCIVKVINSQRRKIHINKFKKTFNKYFKAYCKKTSLGCYFPFCSPHFGT